MAELRLSPMPIVKVDLDDEDDSLEDFSDDDDITSPGYTYSSALSRNIHRFHMSPVTEQDLKRPLPPELFAPITEPYDEQKDFEETYQLFMSGHVKLDIWDPELRERFWKYVEMRNEELYASGVNPVLFGFQRRTPKLIAKAAELVRRLWNGAGKRKR